MYTSESQMFSKEFETRATMAINKVIEQFKALDVKSFAAKAKVGEYEADQIKDWGHRWKRAEQVYQSMIMGFGRKMFEERGPGFLCDEEVHSIERMHFNNDYLFQESAVAAIIGAINCDHWYMFEKVWD